LWNIFLTLWKGKEERGREEGNRKGEKGKGDKKERG
jgi:hypothetical protein